MKVTALMLLIQDMLFINIITKSVGYKIEIRMMLLSLEMGEVLLNYAEANV